MCKHWVQVEAVFLGAKEFTCGLTVRLNIWDYVLATVTE